MANHVPTQTPYDISIACDSDGDTTKGDITVTWQESDGFEDSPPERYAIAFSNDNFVETNYAVANSTGWEEALSYKSYVFTASYRENIFGTTTDTFYAKVRADNDTDASYSEWTSVVSIDCDYGSTTTTTTTTTIPPAVPDNATNVSVNYQGKDVYFAWEYTDGNTLVNEFHINYSYDNATWDRVVITDTSARTYTLDYTNIQTGTFYWTFSVCGDIENGESCTDSDSNNFETTQYVAPTTTLPSEPEPEPEPYVEPEPLPPPPEEIIVDVKVEGVDKTYTQADVNDGTVERDQERIDNEKEYGCFMTNAQIERGDCDILEEEVVEKKEEEVIIKEDEKEQPDTKEIISDDDVVVPEVVVEDKDEDFFDEPKEEVIEDELDQEIPGDDDIREEGVQDKDDKDQDNKEEEIKEEEEIEETKEIILEPEEEPEKFEQETVQDLVKNIKEVEVEDLETEQVIEVLTEVADVGVENLTEVSEDVLKVVSQVVEQSIQKAEELTEEQVEVVATVLNLEDKNDVKVIAEAVKNDEAVAEAVEEYVERAVKNKDVENYTLADVVTEIQTEQFLADPIGAFTDINIQEIDLGAIGNDMTNDQKEKAQEVVVPVIIASQIVASVQVAPVRMRRKI